MKAKRIYLVGFMGAGKSSIGRRLANLMKIRHIDLDEHIEERERRSISTIFANEGQDAFRKLEADALRDINYETDCVISTGGGTPCFLDNMQFMLDNGTVIYLSMSPGMLKSRLEKSKKDRPLLKNLTSDELLQYIEKTLEEREKWYKKANYTVDGDKVDIELLRQILNM